MAIFVNSWPAGVAIALLTLPLIGTAYGVGAVYLAVAVMIGLAAIVLAAAYRSPAAGSTISIVLWLTVLSVPSGGFLADRTGRPGFILVAGCIVFAGLMIALSRSDAVLASVIALGLVCGLPAGPIMSLPARALRPATRAIGMGIFYTVYYAAMMLGPVIGGACAKWSGSAAAAFDFGAAVVLACPVLLWGFNRIAADVPKTA